MFRVYSLRCPPHPRIIHFEKSPLMFPFPITINFYLYCNCHFLLPRHGKQFETVLLTREENYQAKASPAHILPWPHRQATTPQPWKVLVLCILVFACMHVGRCTKMCLAIKEARRGRLWTDTWVWPLGPLEKQQGFLTARPSLQPHKLLVLKKVWCSLKASGL